MSDAAISGQVLALSWNDEHPRFLIRPQIDQAESNKVDLEVGRHVMFAITGEKICTGHWETTSHKRAVCPFRQHLADTLDHQCLPCKKQEVSYFTFTGHSDN